MDIWKYFDITHREHTFCNPMSSEKFDRLVGLLRLTLGARVLDIASGKAEFIIRLAERYRVEGVGVDISPYFIADAKKKHRQRVPEAQLSFLEMDGAEFEPDKPESFDLVACIGASWVWGGHRGTLKALNGMAAPGGWLVVGEPHWRQEPTDEYLEAEEIERNQFGTHYENMEAGRELGLELAYTLVSNQDDWDEYEGLQWYTTERWARENPEDPDAEEVLKRVRRSKEAYLKWGRETMGWAIYVFQKGGRTQ